MNKFKGFTLVELTMVLVIIGVLLAVAIPKYIQYGTYSRISSLNYLVGSITSATDIVRSGYYVQGNVSPVVMADGSTVAVTTSIGGANGTPLGTLLGIGNAINTYGYTVSYLTTGSANTVKYTLQTNCYVVYTEATGMATIGSISGC